MTASEKIASALGSWPRPVFVAIDGAKFADFPATAAQVDVFPRSLFIGQDDGRAVRSGPWFASLDDRRLRSFFRIQGIETSTVFWSGTATEEAVFRHLRSVNLIDIPRPADAPPDPNAPDPETVLFRHWDPAVVALVLPVLDPGQRARLFGPMRTILIQADLLGGLREAKHRADWPVPESGRIRLSRPQMDRIAGAMADGSRQTIVRFLRDAAPVETGAMDAARLDRLLADSESTGRTVGLRTERGFARWAYLMLISQGKIATSTPALLYLAAGAGTSDERVGTLMLAIARELTHRETRP